MDRARDWVVQILNWPGPIGVGSSEKEAIADLRKNLEKIREHRSANHEKMPRPGRRVPIQFAPTIRVSLDLALRDDFITRVLGFEHGSPVFISDQSSLGDFGDESHVSKLQHKISEIYGVDVSDLRDGLICDILERIRHKGP